MIRIPVGQKLTSTATGSSWKPVVCNYCGCQFVYQIKREATGEATSWLWLNNRGTANRARASAGEALHERLQMDIEAFSCPDCGMYQKDMADKLKGEAWRSVGRVALTFGIMGVIVALLGSYALTSLPGLFRSVLMGLIGGFWIWAVVRMVLHAYRLDPNADAKRRRGRAYSEDYPVLRQTELERIRRQNRD